MQLYRSYSDVRRDRNSALAAIKRIQSVANGHLPLSLALEEALDA